MVRCWVWVFHVGEFITLHFIVTLCHSLFRSPKLKITLEKLSFCGKPWTTVIAKFFFPLTFPLYQSLIPSVYPFIFISNTFSFLKKHDVNPSLNEKNPSLNHDVCYVQWYMAKYQYFNCQTLLSTLGLASLPTPIHKNVRTYLYSFNTTSQCCCSFTNLLAI